MERKNNINILCDLGVGGQRGRVFDTKGILGSLSATDYKDPEKVLESKKEEDILTMVQKPHGFNKGGEFTESTTVTSHAWHENNFIKENKSSYRIRKLTPTECYRLMGFTDKDVEKCRAVGVSNTQLYKTAGNSIVTNCIELLFEHLYKAQIDNTYGCFDENFIQAQPM